MNYRLRIDLLSCLGKTFTVRNSFYFFLSLFYLLWIEIYFIETGFVWYVIFHYFLWWGTLNGHCIYIFDHLAWLICIRCDSERPTSKYRGLFTLFFNVYLFVLIVKFASVIVIAITKRLSWLLDFFDNGLLSSFLAR